MPAVTSLLILGAGVAMATMGARKQRRKRLAILRAVANKRRGEVETGGWLGRPTLTLTSEGVELEVSMWSTRHDQFTEYVARALWPGMPWFKAAPSSFTDILGKAIGQADLELGEPIFDDSFSLRTRDVAVARRIWTPARARDMASQFPTSKLECEDDRLRLLQPLCETAEQVEAGIDFLVELVRCDPYGLAILPDLPEAVVRRQPPFPHAELPGPTPIIVGPLLRDGAVRTCVRTAAIGPAERAVPDGVQGALDAIAASLEQTDTELRIWWDGIEADRGRLTTAVELLRRLASGPSQGIFR